MSIERAGYDGPITFVCDACGEIDETRCTQFPGALAKFKSHGGKVVKIDEEWEHYCRECRDD